jgi:two-component system chemotaxis response regulator CheB
MARTHGSAAIGVLLTGMGTDGAEALKVMKDQGATTLVQDRETSVVHGMPGHAISIDAATQVLPSHKIAAALIARISVDRINGDTP